MLYSIVVLVVFVYVAGRRYGRRFVVPLNWRKFQQITGPEIRVWFTQIWSSGNAAAVKSRPATPPPPPITIDNVESELETSPRTLDLSVTTLTLKAH